MTDVRRGVILYGPPASGKDTVTTALVALDPRYVAYQRLKAGTGKSEGYRSVTAAQLQELADAGDLLYQNRRYGNTYAIDRDSLEALFAADRIPVLHLGQVDGILAVEAFPAHWARVLLWCDREITALRSQARGDLDSAHRLEVWDETRQDLADHHEFKFDLVTHTDLVAAAKAAETIHQEVVSNLNRYIGNCSTSISTASPE